MNKDGSHFNPIIVTKETEEEIGKVMFAKYFSNKRLLTKDEEKD